MAEQTAFAGEPDSESTTTSPSTRTPIWVWVLGAIVAYVAVTMLWSMLPAAFGSQPAGPPSTPGEEMGEMPEMGH
jgi:hypothetical protein